MPVPTACPANAGRRAGVFAEFVVELGDGVTEDFPPDIKDWIDKTSPPFGIVHGGVVATMIDTATFWAAFLNLPQDAGLLASIGVARPRCVRRRKPAGGRGLRLGPFIAHRSQ